ncbi:ABC transporter substrate-binding protein [Phycicoccus sp. MAQZ13P-2]|uniref:ABC transporter substrate-binding protein n=1 Tax=Phycicoccus mangrovi TaxID=2840470 RepID=UPI001C007D0C|nr:ABC transporter substrate-binding protein [Phycicoccus mangrovi]MBT9254071.1 ABC transporter substrate-binding protein [Phycicoccus mangrovi]MBT9272451.1 ABC transporter substrate-binding protein [Phycicoccus mangrovi]
MARATHRTALVAATAALALGLSACGGGNIEQPSASGSAGGGGKECGDLRIAVNPWTGYVSNAHVIGYVAQTKLGCKVTYPDVKEEVGWQGMASGSIDTIVENWGHADLTKKYVDEQKSVQDAGLTGNQGIIGWYVPPWMAEKYPDITDWQNLNKYASMFKTSESGGKGQLLDGDPSYVTNDEALVTNLGLDYKVVTGGSEAALITSFRQAEKNKTPLLAYFYDPQWFFSEMKLVKVNLPAYTDGCDADPKKVACDYPPYALNKLIATKFAESGSPAVNLIKKFQWTNDDQNAVSEMIANQNMSPDDAAKKWVEANPDKVAAWLS